MKKRDAARINDQLHPIPGNIGSGGFVANYLPMISIVEIRPSGNRLTLDVQRSSVSVEGANLQAVERFLRKALTSQGMLEQVAIDGSRPTASPSYRAMQRLDRARLTHRKLTVVSFQTHRRCRSYTKCMIQYLFRLVSGALHFVGDDTQVRWEIAMIMQEISRHVRPLRGC